MGCPKPLVAPYCGTFHRLLWTSSPVEKVQSKGIEFPLVIEQQQHQFF
jgi:hypothetical protein